MKKQCIFILLLTVSSFALGIRKKYKLPASDQKKTILGLVKPKKRVSFGSQVIVQRIARGTERKLDPSESIWLARQAIIMSRPGEEPVDFSSEILQTGQITITRVSNDEMEALQLSRMHNAKNLATFVLTRQGLVPIPNQ